METILHNIPRVYVYIGDILVTGKSHKEHLRTLDEVLSRLDTAGLRLKKEKCNFMLPSVEYPGHCISVEELHSIREKVCAILNAPTPPNVSQL